MAATSMSPTTSDEPGLAPLVEDCGGLRGRARVGIVGGTFDPIHVGHVQAGLLARDQLCLDAVVFMPAARSNFKRDLVPAPAADRVAMARLALAGLARCLVSAQEVRRGGVSYTSQTLAEVATQLGPGTRLYFVLGGDALATLPTWHDAATIARHATIAVAARAGSADVARAAERARACPARFTVTVLAGDVTRVSSTQVRGLVARGRSTAGLLDPRVRAYIDGRGLYRMAAGASRREGAE
ncbi:nicotinate (nicotinamide) nucleotide adenylyltransferase [bacterium]|nr:nicotinate (nicotinamide) nucleotide adenylyltransferase [bacterium]